nr:MAG TPA_asm: hypothetical protein [Caudoviricetes sp.]
MSALDGTITFVKAKTKFAKRAKIRKWRYETYNSNFGW